MGGPNVNNGVEDMGESKYTKIHEVSNEEANVDNECPCSSEPSSIVLHWEERICDTDEVDEKTVTFEINLELSQKLGEICSYNKNGEENASNVPNDVTDSNDFLVQEGIESLFPQLVSSFSLSPQSPYAKSSYWSNIALQPA